MTLTIAEIEAELSRTSHQKTKLETEMGEALQAAQASRETAEQRRVEAAEAESKLADLEKQKQQAIDALDKEKKQKLTEYNRRQKALAKKANEYNKLLKEAIESISWIQEECKDLERINRTFKLSAQTPRPIVIPQFGGEVEKCFDDAPRCSVSNESVLVLSKGEFMKRGRKL